MRCRLRLRWQAGMDWRRDGAHRTGGHPFGRFGVFAARAFAPGGDRCWIEAANYRAGEGAECCWVYERPVCNSAAAQRCRHAGRRNLRTGSQSACIAHDSVCFKSDWPATRQNCRALHGGTNAEAAGVKREIEPPYFSVKAAIFPFAKFPGVDPMLGPEMRSTGEVMGIGQTFGEALFKSQLAAGMRLPASGTVLLTVRDRDKPMAVELARQLHQLGYPLVATKGTAAALAQAGIPVKAINKVKEGRPHIVDMLKNGEIALMFTTVDESRAAIADSRLI